MAKRKLTAEETFNLRQTLHVAVLDALISSRRWEPGDLVFQGGTSLHLAHGSPRYSEDLDFLVDQSLQLDQLAKRVAAKLQDSPWLPNDSSLQVARERLEDNPASFIIAVSGDRLIGSVRVKVEMWQSDRQTLQSLSATVMPVSARVKIGTGGVPFVTYVPTSSPPDIYADKIFALGARAYLKPRDVFDIYWLKSQPSFSHATRESMVMRLATYPNTPASQWLQKAQQRRTELFAAGPLIKNDLLRWLPSSWPLTDDMVAKYVDASVSALDEGIALITTIAPPENGDAEIAGP